MQQPGGPPAQCCALPAQPALPTLSPILPISALASRGPACAGRSVFGPGWLALGVALMLCLSQVLAWDGERMAQAAQRLGARASAAVPALQGMIQAGHLLDDAARLAQVNQFYNRRIRFKTDLEVWGQEDFWATPLQVLEAGAGDCEDYAIAKYFTLVAMGVPVARLRLVYVRARLDAQAAQAHMVLAYYPAPNAEPAILDNLMNDIHRASQRPDLTPVFSFNSEGLWQGVGSTSAGDPTVRLSRWRDALARVQGEGFF